MLFRSGFGWQGVECAGLTALGGQRVMLNQWQFAWLPLPAVRRRTDRERWTMPDRLAARSIIFESFGWPVIGGRWPTMTRQGPRATSSA